MDCLADTGLNPNTWIIVVAIAAVTLTAGVIILRRQRRAGLAAIAVLALLLGGSLALGPAHTATAATADCAAAPAPAPVRAPAATTTPTPSATPGTMPSATPTPSVSPSPSTTPAPTPTSTPAPTGTPTPTPTPTCVPGSPTAATTTNISATGTQAYSQIMVTVGDPDVNGVSSVTYRVAFILLGANAVTAADRLGIVIPAGPTPEPVTAFPAALGDPVLAQIPSDMTVTETSLEFGLVGPDPDAGTVLLLDFTFTSSTTDPTRDFGAGDGPEGQITLTWPVTGQGTACDGTALADTLIVTHTPDLMP